MCFYSSLGILNEHFKDRLSLAYGIAMSGAGFGIPVMSQVSSHIVTVAGWRKAVQVMSVSGIMLFCCGLIFIQNFDVKRNGQKMNVAMIIQQKDSMHCLKRYVRNTVQFGKLLFDYKLFAKSKALSMWVLSMTLVLVGYLVPFIYLVNMKYVLYKLTHS